MSDATLKVYAGFLQRVKAFALDYILIGAYLVLVFTLTLTASNYLELGSLFSERVQAQVSGFLVVTLPITLYFTFGESSVRQATWGKDRSGLRVVSMDGKRVGFLKAFSRTLLKFIPWELSHTLLWDITLSNGTSEAWVNIGFGLVYGLISLNILWMYVSKSNQTLYDYLAKTHVIKVAL